MHKHIDLQTTNYAAKSSSNWGGAVISCWKGHSEETVKEQLRFRCTARTCLDYNVLDYVLNWIMTG